jgi:CDP-diacylglycerol--glycerol-3-phosphate 3-phosphatidyltransferase
MQTPAEIVWWIALVLVFIAVALTIISGVQFFMGVWRQRHALRSAA